MEWMENLSDDLKDNKSLQQFTSLEAALQGYVDAKSDLGNTIRISGPDASAEQRAETYNKVMKHMPELVLKPNPDNKEQLREFHAMLGVPEDATGYNTDDLGLSDELLHELTALAHGVDMSKSQFRKYAEKMSEMQGMTKQQTEDTRVRMGAELKTEWGMAFEDRYAVVEKHLLDNPDLGRIEDMTPTQLKGHYQMSRSLNGVKQMHAQPTPSSNFLTPDEAKAQMREIDENPIRLSTDPQHRHEQKRLSTRRIELAKLANPELYN